MPAGKGTHGPAARPAGNSGRLSAEPDTRRVGPGQASPRYAQLPAARTGQCRDPVLDALRGACLVSMVVAHLAPDSVLYRVTHPLVWVDGAAGFIFFSGLVLGITQRARSAGVGGAACRRWLWQRAAVIYLAHVTLVSVALGLRAATAGPAFVPAPAEIGPPPAVVLAVLTLGLQPPFLDILPLYVVLLIGAVGLTELLRRDRGALCLALSLAVYIASQIRADLFTPGDGRGGRVPWVWGAWQLLFVGGLVAGWHWRRGLRPWAVRHRRRLLAGCAALFTTLVVTAQTLPHSARTADLVAAVEAVFAKFPLRPGVPIYLVAAAVVGYAVVAGLRGRCTDVLVHPLARLGARSLDCYVALSLTQLAVATVRPDGPARPTDLLVVVVTLAGLWLLAGRRRPLVPTTLPLPTRRRGGGENRAVAPPAAKATLSGEPAANRAIRQPAAVPHRQAGRPRAGAARGRSSADTTAGDAHLTDRLSPRGP